MSITSFTQENGELQWVKDICRQTLDFWATYASTEPGKGYFACLRGDGQPYDLNNQHLVASARFVINFAMGAELFNSDYFRGHAIAALDFLRSAHRDRKYGGYHWIMHDDKTPDSRKVLYGHAFVLLAAAHAVEAGLPDSEQFLADIVEALRVHFSGDDVLAEPNYWSSDWQVASETRGQNPNMHLCEAYIAAYEATEDASFLGRALDIATTLTRDLALETPHHVVWENFDGSWGLLHWPGSGFEDNSTIESKFNVFPGHQSEWAKLLGILYRHTGRAWLLERSLELYDVAWSHGWDHHDDQGFYMVLDDELRVPTEKDAIEEINANWLSLKSYWSPPEAIGAAAVLQSLTGDSKFARDRELLWDYCRRQMIDEALGGWYKIPTSLPKRSDALKGDLFDPDYHALGACFETLRSLSGVNRK
jgi:mannose/cellobiose epimerase-like protein (N-acyl-D-glucosamine 2-epimerase family)